MDLTEEEIEFIEAYCLPESTGKLIGKDKTKKVCGFS